MRASNGKKVLISGASFAGLSSAYWMHELGYDVTIVEVGPGLRTGGTRSSWRAGTTNHGTTTGGCSCGASNETAGALVALGFFIAKARRQRRVTIRSPAPRR